MHSDFDLPDEDIVSNLLYSARARSHFRAQRVLHTMLIIRTTVLIEHVIRRMSLAMKESRALVYSMSEAMAAHAKPVRAMTPFENSATFSRSK